MVMERLGDSLARIVVAGLVFGYFSLRIKKRESSEG